MKRCLVLIMLLAMTGMASAENMVFPADAGLIDVTQPPYGLKGDGKTDNTAALQKAFLELRTLNRTLYFPNGTYLFSGRINISGDKASTAHSDDRFLNIQGQSQAGVVLKLADNSPGFDNADKPKTFISLYEGQSTGDVMHSYVRNITVEIGAGNPGAAAFRYLTNNTGAMYDVTIRSADPQNRGAIGLDLRQSQNGPGLLKNITVNGFDYGIQTDNTFSLVFEHITLLNQRKAAFNAGNSRLTIRDLKTRGGAPALVGSQWTHLTLVEADLTGEPSQEVAIVCKSRNIFVRDATAKGYQHVIKTIDGKFVDGPIGEWFEGKGNSLFGAEPKTLRLPIKETPEVPWESDLAKWVKVEPGSDKFQVAIDQAARDGKTTVYFPKLGPGKGEGKYRITGPVRVHGSVNRIIAMENFLDIADPDGKLKDGKPAIVFEDLKSDVVVMERFFSFGGWNCPRYVWHFENKSGKAVVIRNMPLAGEHFNKSNPSGEWFLEDVGTVGLHIGRGEKCWARQLNPESPQPNMVEADGGQLWILGLKTEGRARHIIARNGAKVELLGGVSYQSWGNQPIDPPMFTVVNSDASFTFGFYHYNLPFTTIVEETVGTETKTLPRTNLTNYHLPVYAAHGAGKAGQGSGGVKP